MCGAPAGIPRRTSGGIDRGMWLAERGIGSRERGYPHKRVVVIHRESRLSTVFGGLSTGGLVRFSFLVRGVGHRAAGSGAIGQGLFLRG